MIEKIALTVPGQDGDYEIQPVARMPSDGFATLEAVIQWAILTLFIVASLLAVALIVYGGIRIAASGGDKAAIESGRKIITFAIIGLVIIFTSYMIMGIIQSVLGVQLLMGIPFVS